MNLYDYSQFSPYIIAALCFVAMTGLSKPTVEKPDTWHMTYLIVGLVSFLNVILIEFHISAYLSENRLSEIGDKAYRQSFAWVYGMMGIIDAVTAYLVLKLSQKGRLAIVWIMSAFVFVNLMAIIDIVAYTELNYNLGTFSGILTTSDIVYENYDYWILSLNILQVSFLLGGTDGWTISNMRNLFRSIVSTSSISGVLSRCRIGLASIRRNPAVEGSKR